MSHLLCCQILKLQCTLSDLASFDKGGKACIQAWKHVVRGHDKNKTHTSRLLEIGESPNLFQYRASIKRHQVWFGVESNILTSSH